jgi:hypothetical protein
MHLFDMMGLLLHTILNENVNKLGLSCGRALPTIPSFT